MPWTISTILGKLGSCTECEFIALTVVGLESGTLFAGFHALGTHRFKFSHTFNAES